jgi:hypothetical protein
MGGAPAGGRTLGADRGGAGADARASAGPCHGAETVTHARIKRRIDHALSEGLAKGGHDREVFVSGPKVQIDANTAFEPDLVVSCGKVPDGLLVPEPLIVGRSPVREHAR